MMRTNAPLRGQPGRLRRTGVVALVATLVFAGCATKRDFRDLAAQLRAQEASRQAAMANIEALIVSLGDTMNGHADQLVEARGDLMRELLEIRDQLIQVQELSGQNSRTLTALRDDVESRRDRLDTTPRGGMSTPAGNNAQASEDFDAAQEAFDRGSMSAARRGFEQFIRQYPDDSRSADAHYQLADILLRDESSDAALAELSRIPERYPTSARVPEALYRMGSIEMDRGNPDAARRLFDRVVNTYPDSDVATLARERLSEIG